MNPDPFSLCVSVGRIFKYAYRFNSLDEEIRVCKAALEDTSDLVSDVISTSNRLQTLFSPDTKRRYDRAIQRTNLAIENARRVINLETRARGEIRITAAKIEWMLKYRAHKDLVRQCHDTLLQIKREMSQIPERRLSLEAYFRNTRQIMFAALVTRASENAIKNLNMEGPARGRRNSIT